MTERERLANLRACERGTALLEYGLVLIVSLLLLFGVVDFARALYAYHFVANAAREGARYAMVRGQTWTTNCPSQSVCSCADTTSAGCTADASLVEQYVQNLASGVGIGTVTVNTQSTFMWPGTGPAGAGGNNGGCDTTQGPNDAGCLVVVQVQYPFNFVLPFMPTTNCTVNNVAASICMSSTSEMVISR